MAIRHVNRLCFNTIEKLAITTEKYIDYFVTRHGSHATARIDHNNQLGAHLCRWLHEQPAECQKGK